MPPSVSLRGMPLQWQALFGSLHRAGGDGTSLKDFMASVSQIVLHHAGHSRHPPELATK